MHVHVCMLVKQTYENNFGIEVETEYYVDRLSIKDQIVRDNSNDNDPLTTHQTRTLSFYHTAALVVWPKDCRMEALCYNSESVLKWLEEQHKCEPGRTNGDLERYLTSKVGYKTHFEILPDFCVKHDCHDAACLVMKKWGMTHGNSSTGYGFRTLGSFPASSLVQINWGLLVKMKEAAGLFGLKKDEKVTQLFSELLSRALKYSSHNKKLAEVAIWLGNEEMVKVVVKYARSGNFNDEKDDSSLIESAKTWDDVARDGLKKVINAKICYFLGNGDEEVSCSDRSDDEVDEEDEEKEEGNKRCKLNPRAERVEYEQKRIEN
ncbi:hypothetical protein SELMODRAFT_423654 [Selaginella moellendorffii]|uniref:Uncharacterized protein n=1 Tax=Selaginella moellendorffii TaxID=88036 RepID=D8SME3_SELML|nr:hypothetical protein SELMODRAFT_423654 [Selaginella moellendorffii]